MIAELKRIHDETELPWRALCEEFSYATIMRWKTRFDEGQELIQKTGPQKSHPLDWARLYELIAQLPHGRSRTQGTTALHRRLMDSVSRRQVRQVAEQVRQEDLNSMKRIHWNRPGLAWTIDATQYGVDVWKIIPLRDLASHYRFIPLVSDREQGVQIASHVEELFEEHDPPLIFKRDNGSPFNCLKVDEVLERHLVVPLNNPPHYPRYNGAMENTIANVKRRLDQRGGSHIKAPEILQTFLELVTHEFNHQSNRSLSGRTPCQVWNADRLFFSRRERRQILRLLYQEFSRTIANRPTVNHRVVAAVWRQTVESWLRRQGLITIVEPKQNQKCVNHFSASFGLTN